ncbi:MAG: Gldg family protein [Eubacteriales bacterium]|nr:Gldg family protein [Eubacteriales bacterium]
MDSNQNNAVKRPRFGKTAKMGTYTFVVSAIVIAVIIIVNLLVNLLPASITTFDTSANKFYTISDSTQKYLSGLKEDVNIRWICQGGNTESKLETFLGKYVSLSSHLKLNTVDPVKDPSALDKYLTEADEQPANYSLIIESNRRYKIIDATELFYYYNSMLDQSYGLGMVPYSVYESYYTYFYYAESSGYTTEQYFYGDDIITKAIEYVTLESIPHVYIMEGHGEQSFSETLLGFISQNNISYEMLTLADAVPRDANCVVINTPKFDLTASEASLLRDYLINGGNLMLITSPENTSFNNLMSIMSDYGLSPVDGIIYEGNASYYKDNAYNIKPSVDTSHQITSALTKFNAYMPKAHGISISDDTGGAEVTSLLTTSDSAYTMLDGVKGDSGAMSVGAAVSKPTDNGNTQIVWYSSSEAFTDETAASSSYGNYYYFFYSLYWMNESYESELATVEGPSVSEPILDGLTESSVRVWSIVFTVLIPGIILTAGIVVWVKRRKR